MGGCSSLCLYYSISVRLIQAFFTERLQGSFLCLGVVSVVFKTVLAYNYKKVIGSWIYPMILTEEQRRERDHQEDLQRLRGFGQ